MKLYFGNSVTTATTLMIVVLLGFVAYAALNRDSRHWGIRSLILLVFGLVVCCFAAARDGFDRSVQNVIDGSCAPEFSDFRIFRRLSVISARCSLSLRQSPHLSQKCRPQEKSVSLLWRAAPL